MDDLVVMVFCVCIVDLRNLKKVSLILESSSLEHFQGSLVFKVACLTVRFLFVTLPQRPTLKNDGTRWQPTKRPSLHYVYSYMCSD